MSTADPQRTPLGTGLDVGRRAAGATSRLAVGLGSGLGRGLRELPSRRRSVADRSRALSSGPRAVWATAREALERPLTTYYLLLAASALLLTIGLIMVLSASSVYSFRVNDGDSYAIVRRQLIWVGIGLPAAWVASRLPLRWVRRAAQPAFVVSLLLLVATVFLGVDINGNQNWLRLGPLQIQPSEIAKLSLILWAAHTYANKERRLASLHEMVVPVVPGMMLATALVVIGHDLGTALVLASLLIGMLWVVGAPARLFLAGLVVAAAGSALMIATNEERRTRVTGFLHPFNDLADTGYQTGHGLYALSSGGLFGQGIGASQQKWGSLPEAHTDFIFAVLGEELGLVGTLLVVGLFLAIAFAAHRLARDTEQPFVRYATFGVVVWLIGQMMINLGVVLGMLPVVGLPLPLVSYGGSSLVPTLAALGLLVGFARREPAAARALAERRRATARVSRSRTRTRGRTRGRGLAARGAAGGTAARR